MNVNIQRKHFRMQELVPPAAGISNAFTALRQRQRAADEGGAPPGEGARAGDGDGDGEDKGKAPAREGEKED
jgi:hypothetical protein